MRWPDLPATRFKSTDILWWTAASAQDLAAPALTGKGLQ